MESDRTGFKKIQKMFRGGRLLKYKAGEIILRAGDLPSGVYYLSSGYVKAYALTDEGDENLHLIYKPPELFPLVWALQGRAKNVFYEALTTAELWRLSKEEFLSAAEADNAVAMELLRQLADQFSIYADRIDNLEYSDAYQRVVYRLLFASARFGKRRGSSVTIEAPMTHQLIANSVRLSRETTSREFQRLERQKLITYKGRYIVIPDVHKLQAELGEIISEDFWGLK